MIDKTKGRSLLSILAFIRPTMKINTIYKKAAACDTCVWTVGGVVVRHFIPARVCICGKTFVTVLRRHSDT